MASVRPGKCTSPAGDQSWDNEFREKLYSIEKADLRISVVAAAVGCGARTVIGTAVSDRGYSVAVLLLRCGCGMLIGQTAVMESDMRVTFGELPGCRDDRYYASMKKLVLLAVIALLGVPSITKADVEDRLYDFTDAYYLQNGINPAAIDGRRQVGPLAAADTPIFPYQRGVRALLTLPNYDHSGNAWYFTVLGGFNTSAFTANAAGQRARQIADSSIEYVFPRQGTDPVGLGALRQSVMLDMRNGYFSNNKLALWLHVWVSYAARALSTSEGQKMMNDLARRNGRDLDGNAIIASVSEIDNLFSKGFITKTTRPLNDVLRYSICPVIKDPRDGGIAGDQFLAYTRKPDGSALEPEFLENFISLQTTGEEAH